MIEPVFSEHADFMLLNTGWDRLWGTSQYFEGYPVLDEEAILFVTMLSLKAVGMDMPSPDLPESPCTRHVALMQTGKTLIIENLRGIGRIGSCW